MTEAATPADERTFAKRLREVVNVFGGASALARAIERSEGAVRKWLRASSEPHVTDLRKICIVTGTNLEWLVNGVGYRELPSAATRDPRGAYEPTEATNYALLDDIMQAVDAEISAAGMHLESSKRSSLVVTLYGLFRERRSFDREALARLVRLSR